MALQHYLPATFLASFSIDNNPDRRQRILTIGDKKNGHIFNATASKVCGIKGFYTLKEILDNPNLVDDSWSYYEKGLTPAIDQLINGSLSALTWANTLVPFVSALLVRGPEFNVRFEKRMENLGVDDLVSPDNTNMARLLEKQRLSSSILASEWILMKKNGDGQLITNDLGYTPFSNPNEKDIGIAISISLEYILAIVPKHKKIIAVSRNGIWIPNIIKADLPLDNHIGFNSSIARIAQRFIIGSDLATVKKYLQRQDKPPNVPEPIQLGFMTGYKAMIHEWSWFNLIIALSEPPKRENAIIYVDYLKNSARH